jgi:hypothetical protein
MPKKNALVSTFVRFDAKPEQLTAQALRASPELTFELEGGTHVRLDPENPRSLAYARVLAGLSQQGLPVYLELDEESSFVTHLLIPHVTRVAQITESSDGSLEVLLEFSSARHRLPKASPDFAQFAEQLREAIRLATPLLLTEDDAHEILDLRAYKPSPDGPEVPLPPFPRQPPKIPKIELKPKSWLKELLIRIWYWCWWPWWWFGCKCISLTKAQQAFDAMNATSCDPTTVPAPCIPFLYPDDGCWGRAHEMCRLMIAMGLSPKKVWIQGSLHVVSANKPDCNVYWGWHVAPTLCVRTSLFRTKTMVIDPALFPNPVDISTWKGKQGDPGAVLTESEAEIFYLFSNSTDPTYSQTNTVLSTYRLYLQNRTIQYGPPPYAACM